MRSFGLVFVIASSVTGKLSAQSESKYPLKPQVAAASKEAKQSMARFKIPAKMKIQLFAAEPLVANPVSFTIDNRGRLFICESFRQNKGVTDNRGHDQKWLDDDLAARTVADRRRYHLKHLKEKAVDYIKYDDRIRVLIDSNKDGKADKSTVYANHFNKLVDGTGAGVLFRKGKVLFTCIPNLWELEDKNGDGRADTRKILHTGYGVRVAFRGHDLHGLTIGPDGKVYYSIGDRGYNIPRRGHRFVNPESGAIFRCNLDGSELEVVATGLRNPQELAFDEYGNLFTGDNNSDSGDRARWVQIVEGGDTGWRMAYQYLKDRGPFNREKIWHPFHPEQPAHIVPPIANFADGPSGLAFYPGTGLGDHFRGKFFLCDFRGNPGRSGIRTFRVKNKGATFDLVDSEQTFWRILATDLAFGPDGHLYVSDWVNGWNGLGKGRIYRISDSRTDRGLADQVQELLAGKLQKLQPGDWLQMLNHPDRRIRQESQFLLAEAGQSTALLKVASTFNKGRLPRIHAIWALGQIGRLDHTRGKLAELLPLLKDRDPEIRTQAAKILADCRFEPAANQLIRQLADTSLRVRAQAALSLSKLAASQAVPALIRMLEENDNRDPVVRHCGMMGLTKCATSQTIVALAKHPSPSVRRVLVVALRRQRSPLVATFLSDAEPIVVAEAARAIHDVPIDAAFSQLAKLSDDGPNHPSVVRRALNANFRLGGSKQAIALARYAADEGNQMQFRQMALRMLSQWSKPSNRDWVLGMWRPLRPRQVAVAANALRKFLPGVLSAEAKIRQQGAQVAARLGIREVAPALHKTFSDTSQPAAVRASALLGLATVKTKLLKPALNASLLDKNDLVRAAGRTVLARTDAKRAIPLLARSTLQGTIIERQQAYTALQNLKQPEVNAIFIQSLKRLIDGKIAAATQLDLLEAATARKDPNIQSLLKQYESKRPQNRAGKFRESLLGGSAARGKHIFFNRTQASCLRCHKIKGRGGEVGPDLSKIAKDKKRLYLLEAIVDPNKKIAKGFDSVIIVDNEGRIVSGVLKGQTDKAVDLITVQGRRLQIDKENIDEMRSSKSAMPDDLPKNLSRRDVRDLVEYLSNLK